MLCHEAITSKRLKMSKERTISEAPCGCAGCEDMEAKTALAALAIMALGYIGVFFGRLLQAAVSRHRERLADASSVQFTRNPQGLTVSVHRV